MKMSTTVTLYSVVVTLLISYTYGFTPRISQQHTTIAHQTVSLHAVTSPEKKKAYVPKWKKSQTLAEESGENSKKNAKGTGLIGTIPVVFNQGDDTRTTMAIPGQPLSDVAAQAGQFIRYGCKKGECGTCQAMCDGEWIRPCVSKIPVLAAGEEYTVTFNAIKSKTTNSGKFFSVRSFFMGFYNNVLGMVGFVKQRRAARKNFQERVDIEMSIEDLAAEKRRLAEQAEADVLKP